MFTLYRNFVVVLFWSISFFITSNGYSQDSCYDCNKDSLRNVLAETKDDNKKIELLRLLIDFKITNLGNTSSPMAELKTNLQLLIDLSKTNTISDIDAYKNILDGILFFEKQDFLKTDN